MRMDFLFLFQKDGFYKNHGLLTLNQCLEVFVFRVFILFFIFIAG